MNHPEILLSLNLHRCHDCHFPERSFREPVRLHDGFPFIAGKGLAGYRTGKPPGDAPEI
jgi:hypothetical protein